MVATLLCLMCLTCLPPPATAQILDFSRTVHEDLSNFDPAGAWALLLDEFVDYLRSPQTLSAAAVRWGQHHVA